MSWKPEVNHEAVMWLESYEGMHSNPHKNFNRQIVELIDDIKYDSPNWVYREAANSAQVDPAIEERNAA